MARLKQPAPGEWRYTVGEVPVLLTALERPDKKLAIYTRVWNGKRYEGGVKALCGTIRDDRGRIIPEREIKAQQLAVERQAALTSGLEEVGVPGRLTLGAGFRRLLLPKEGKYAGDTRWKEDVTRNKDVILGYLGADLLWSQVRHAHYRKLWRELAHEHARSGKFGRRMAEVICGTLQSAARWLQTEGAIEPGEGQPAAGWTTALRTDWEEITHKPNTKPKRPRYTLEESTRLWAALPKADPRLHLGMEIGAELRLGQVPRSRRSDVLASPDGSEPLYAVQVHGRGKKLGETVVLTPEQRGVLRAALEWGYLREMEQAWKAKEIPDYYLLTGGHLRQWFKSKKGDSRLAQVKNARRKITETGLKKMWHKLETLAGVEHMEGRNWYGMRRLQSDRAEDVEGDARVLNKMGGWAHTATREKYQEEGRTEIAEKTAEARRKIRPRKDIGTESGEAEA